MRIFLFLELKIKLKNCIGTNVPYLLREHQ